MGYRGWLATILLALVWPAGILAQDFNPPALPTASPTGQPANGSSPRQGDQPAFADHGDWLSSNLVPPEWPANPAVGSIGNQSLQATFAPPAPSRLQFPPAGCAPSGPPAGPSPGMPAAGPADSRASIFQMVMAAGAVSGRLFNRGRPLVNCRVLIVPMRQQDGAYAFDPERKILDAMTDAQGTYQFISVAPGAYKLMWLPRGENRWIRRISMRPDVTVRAGETTHLKDIRVALQTIN